MGLILRRSMPLAGFQRVEANCAAVHAFKPHMSVCLIELGTGHAAVGALNGGDEFMAFATPPAFIPLARFKRLRRDNKKNVGGSFGHRRR